VSFLLRRKTVARYSQFVDNKKERSMTTFHFASNQVSVADLPRPDAASVQSGDCALPRPLPAVTDSGRISFGAAARLPLQK
jgi:hypothetical protein